MNKKNKNSETEKITSEQKGQDSGNQLTKPTERPGQDHPGKAKYNADEENNNEQTNRERETDEIKNADRGRLPGDTGRVDKKLKEVNQDHTES